jgi:hypothetical protein
MNENKNVKPTYGAPVVIPLGELARATGQASCHDGTTASDCSTGLSAANNCNLGGTAASQCQPGSTPGKKCRPGRAPVE